MKSHSKPGSSIIEDTSMFDPPAVLTRRPFPVKTQESLPFSDLVRRKCLTHRPRSFENGYGVDCTVEIPALFMLSTNARLVLTLTMWKTPSSTGMVCGRVGTAMLASVQ
ncbi:hypothetical protein MPTK1_5g02630 [Marchantia polymorpha subsp. ruderalis]|uniref:Uncharacterized protein n=2 Tax=Marchantia polymorpha TaxID=3197 RepID=A0AAF6BE90_MARPO|nr:hypothetical protein MARPO_0124s0060 [Marchantia polymorpha]BBN10324.1 hypothetical protein Mp_5g02630 [Marchantia polymorpha subsp. ruderalis]|eukprot:PTQ30494.1 hypothetical protein MARPO_0124s0060 [Marchantia polymorpha]